MSLASDKREPVFVIITNQLAYIAYRKQWQSLPQDVQTVTTVDTTSDSSCD